MYDKNMILKIIFATMNLKKIDFHSQLKQILFFLSNFKKVLKIR
jgi:hypothetical protein